MSDVEIWFTQKTELSWFLRSNTEIEQFLSYRKAARSETDFFNRIGQKQSLDSPISGHLGQVLDTMLDAMRVGYSDARITTSEPTRGHAKPTRIEHEGISIPLKC
ncbi:hypothetical protein ACQKEM_06265 [Pseudomonas sp. NPDC077382]